MEQAIPVKPLWLRLLQFPLIRIVLLGGIIFFMMGLNNGFMEKLKGNALASIAITIAMGLLAIAIYVGYGKFIERREVSELYSAGMGREWATGALIGAGLYSACALILIVLGMYRIEGLNPWTFLIPAVAMALSSGIFEELFFRGVLFRSVEEMFGSWIALAVSSLVFGFAHLVNPAGTIQGAIYISIEAGLLLAAAYLVTRRLWLSIGFHMAWNYTQSAIFSGVVSGGVTDPGLLRDSIRGPELLTGGSFGMEESIFALILCTTAGVIMLMIAIRRGHIVRPPWKRSS
jgi:membrane protease YdiL (CAAX protease family)